MSLKLALSRLFVLPDPLKLAGERLTIAVLVAAALALVAVSKGPSGVGEQVRLLVRDPLVPALSALQVPIDGAVALGRRAGALLAVYRENERLRIENARLRGREIESVQLGVENRALRGVLNMPPRQSGGASWASGRLVADGASPFSHTRLLDVGAAAGLDVGMAVLASGGLVGRVTGVGRQSSRVMLLTDFNSKIPVLVESSGDPALLEGDNTGEPKLRFMPLDPSFQVGDRVLTSGSGGVLPAGLLVGVVSRVGDAGVSVRPFVDWNRLDVVSVLLSPALPPPEAVTDAPAPGGGTDLPPVVASALTDAP